MTHEIPQIEVDLRDYNADKIAHNAALTPDKLERALSSNIPHIEVDLSLVDGGLVVAHEAESYLALPTEARSLQDPVYVFHKILEAGKLPFLDLKKNIKIEDLEPYLPLLTNPGIMVSSHFHSLLMDLQKTEEFNGRVLFSFEKRDVLDAFLNESNGQDLSEFGVSIQHQVLNQEIGDNLKKMGLKIAAWNPESPQDIATAINNRADIVTSDNFKALDKIGKKRV